MLNGTIPSAVSETAYISICAPDNAPLQNKGVRSNKVFMVSTGDVAPSS